MARKSKIELQVRLLKVTTDQFFVSDDLAAIFANKDKELLMSNGIEFGIDVSKAMIGCRFKFEIYEKHEIEGKEGKLLLLIQAGTHFKMEREDCDKLYSKNKNTFTVPVAAATMMVTVAVGTARGILHAKTEGRDFNGIFVPLIDPVLNEDLIIDLKGGKVIETTI